MSKRSYKLLAALCAAALALCPLNIAAFAEDIIEQNAIVPEPVVVDEAYSDTGYYIATYDGSAPEPADSSSPLLHSSDQEYVYNCMIALKSSYPEGKPWTNNDKYVWEKIYYGEDMTYPYTKYTGAGCVAFCMILSDAAFGDAPAYEHKKFNYDDLRVGDILRVENDQHSVIILEKSSTGIVIAEGNYNSSIHWGRTLTKADVMKANYYVTRYDPNEKPEEKDDFVIQDGVLVKYNGKGGNVVIPDTVTEIVSEVFKNNETITGVVIPDSVTSVGTGIFAGCSKLESISIGSGLQKIGNFSTAGLVSLKTITVSSSNTKLFVKDDALYQKYTDTSSGTEKTILVLYAAGSSRTSLTVDPGTDTIVYPGFNNAKNLKIISFPNTIDIEPESDCFSGCTSLQNINVTGGKTGYYSNNGVLFYNNGADDSIYLYPAGRTETSYTVPTGINYIGASSEKSSGWAPFEGRVNLKKIILPDTAKSIANFAFWGCTSLTEINIPDSVSYIGLCVFNNCSSLTELKLPGQLNAIFPIFENCTNLKKLTIPKSVTSIYDFGQGNMFEGCNSLRDIYYEGTKEEWEAINKCDMTVQGGCTVHCTDGDAPLNDNALLVIGSRYPTIADAVAKINADIKAGTAEDLYTIKLLANHSESKAVSLPDVPVTLMSTADATLEVPSVTAKNDLTISGLSLITSKGTAAAVTAKKTLTALDSYFGATKVTGLADISYCKINGALTLSAKTGANIIQNSDCLGKISSSTCLELTNCSETGAVTAKGEVVITGPTTVNGAITVNGNVGQTYLNAVTVNGKITAGNDLVLSECPAVGAITAKAGLVIDGTDDHTATGAITASAKTGTVLMADTDVRGKLTCSCELVMARCNVTGNLTAKGALSTSECIISGNVSAQSKTEKSYLSQTGIMGNVTAAADLGMTDSAIGGKLTAKGDLYITGSDVVLGEISAAGISSDSDTNSLTFTALSITRDGIVTGSKQLTLKLVKITDKKNLIWEAVNMDPTNKKLNTVAKKFKGTFTDGILLLSADNATGVSIVYDGKSKLLIA